MALYMKIDGIDKVEGSATVEDVGGKKGLIPIDSMAFGSGRSISMETGATSAGEMSTVSLSEINISRSTDGASAILQTLQFAPGDLGKTMFFLVAKNDRGGKGLIVSLMVELTEARLSSYSISASGSDTNEGFSIAYSAISISHYRELPGGKVEKGDVVKFNVSKGMLESQAKV